MGEFSYVCSKCGDHDQLDWMPLCILKIGDLYVQGQYDGYGRVEVFVPEAHRFGETGLSYWQKLKRFDLRDDSLRVQHVERQDRDPFFAEIRNVLQVARESGESPHALIFLHGFNVSFEEAAIRAAQIGFDLKVPRGRRRSSVGPRAAASRPIPPTRLASKPASEPSPTFSSEVPVEVRVVATLAVVVERLMDRLYLPPTVLPVMAQRVRALMAHRSALLPQPSATSPA